LSTSWYDRTWLMFEIKLNEPSLNKISSLVISSSSTRIRSKIKWINLKHSILDSTRLGSNTALCTYITDSPISFLQILSSFVCYRVFQGAFSIIDMFSISWLKSAALAFVGIIIVGVTPCFLQKYVSENFDFYVTLRHH